MVRFETDSLIVTVNETYGILRHKRRVASGTNVPSVRWEKRANVG